ncbi:hypothetical protein LINPERHAP2_LOCUS42323 [Linum perenne]
MAWINNSRKIQLQLDSKAVIQMLLTENKILHHHAAEVMILMSSLVVTRRSKFSILIERVMELLTTSKVLVTTSRLTLI